MELTDSQGNIAWEASYKAWGEARITISEAARKAGLRNPIRFQGQHFDEETGLHYNRFRYYEPVTGRFVSKDPISLKGGMNLQQYAPNPTAWVDPFGLAKGKATINWHDNRGEENAYGHYSVETHINESSIKTHQEGGPGTLTQVTSDVSDLPAPAKSKKVDLPNATAAQELQTRQLGKIGPA